MHSTAFSKERLFANAVSLSSCLTLVLFKNHLISGNFFEISTWWSGTSLKNHTCCIGVLQSQFPMQLPVTFVTASGFKEPGFSDTCLTKRKLAYFPKNYVLKNKILY